MVDIFSNTSTYLPQRKIKLSVPDIIYITKRTQERRKWIQRKEKEERMNCEPNHNYFKKESK